VVSRAMRFFMPALVGLLGLFAACGGPRDVTPHIEVSPGAAGRIGLIASRSGKRAPPPSAPRARAHPMAAGGELQGPSATGRPGDWVLENGEVVFVIDALGGGGGFAESGGNLIDAADARVRKDELGQLFTYFGAFPRQGVYTSIEAREEPDGSAVVVARGRELLEREVLVETEYRLAAGDRALLLRTTLRNRGSARVTGLGLGDAIQWGGAEKFAPGKAVGFRGSSSGPFIGALGRFTSYAITSTDGTIEATSGGGWTDTEQRKNVDLEPGAVVAYERVFVVGERPDAASVVAELTKASGGEVGRVEIALVDPAGARIPADLGAKVLVKAPSGAEVMSIVRAPGSPALAGEVPPGKWTLSYAPSAGRRPNGADVTVEVAKGRVARATLPVTAASAVSFGPCEDAEGGTPLPCRVTIEGREGTASPYFGPGHVAGPAKNQIILGPGETLRLPIPSGRYRVSASRGPEYAFAISDLVVPDQTSAAAFRLRRVLDTPGYVATDVHQHTILSADAPVATRDRVLANAAEGVEIAVASEHNNVVDLQPLVRELGLTQFLVQIAGNEITTDASKRPWGHANIFPLDVNPRAPRGGAFATRDRSPGEIFAEARALGGARVIQINHPRSGSNGYFDQLGFDPRTGRAASADYEAGFDALEVWNGKNASMRDKVLNDFFALLRSGQPVTPIAATDTHGIVGEEPGYPRTLVRVRDDTSLETWDASRTADLVQQIRKGRDVVLTNGPFVEVSANGAGIGGLARAERGRVTVKVRVTSTPFAQVERVEIRRVHGPPKSAPVTMARLEGGAAQGNVSFTLDAPKDDAFIVSASGTQSMRPLLSGDDRETAPFAMTGAIWIDADGDGKALGR
jgi:hypothetical protein